MDNGGNDGGGGVVSPGPSVGPGRYGPDGAGVGCRPTGVPGGADGGVISPGPKVGPGRCGPVDAGTGCVPVGVAGGGTVGGRGVGGGVASPGPRVGPGRMRGAPLGAAEGTGGRPVTVGGAVGAGLVVVTTDPSPCSSFNIPELLAAAGELRLRSRLDDVVDGLERRRVGRPCAARACGQ